MDSTFYESRRRTISRNAVNIDYFYITTLQMKQILLVLLVLSMILTVYFAYRMYKHGTCSAEGFEGGEKEENENEENEENEKNEEKKEKGEQSETNNALLSLMGNIKRINGYLMDPTMWAHRIGLIGMTPVEMARQELNRQKQEQT